MNSIKLLLLTLAISAFQFLYAQQTYYLNPENGNLSGDGSLQNPWPGLVEVIENNMIESRMWNEHPKTETSELVVKNAGALIKGGDTLILLEGYHGSLEFREYYNTDYITIRAAEGAEARMEQFYLNSGCNWKIEGLTISPEFTNNGYGGTLVQFKNHSWTGEVYNISIENCTLYTVWDASNFTMEEWSTKTCTGITVNGEGNVIRNNYLKNVKHGINTIANNSETSYNTIENFAADGIRGIGNDLLFEYNLIMNCYDVDDNHDDGFQSWSINDEPPRERVTLRGNTIISYTDPSQPFRGSLQGIGCFDGMYIDWVIENNVVYTTAYHGISLYGAQNCRIVNNTVLQRDKEFNRPWIMFHDHKDGTKNTNCIIRNNLCNLVTTSEGTTADHNIEIGIDEYDDYFVNPASFDFHLLETAPAIDSGSTLLAPIKDADGVLRPQRGKLDVGAYEFNFNDPEPTRILAGRLNTSLMLYPNPCSSNGAYINIQGMKYSSKASVFIYDISGREVLQTVLQENTCTLNLMAGLYTFKLMDGNVINHALLVVQ